MKKVLIIDDDPSISELIGDFCSEAGFEIKIVNDSREAFATAQAWKPELITLDLEMPNLDGVEVLRQLQGSPDTQRVPVVIISVVAKGAKDQGLLDGAKMIFEKPLKFKILMDRLRQLATPEGSSKEPHFEPVVGSLS